MTRRRNRTNELRVGGLLLLALFVLGWLSIRIGAVGGLADTVEVKAVFDDAAGLVVDSAVKVAGVQVGRVKSLEVEFDQAVAVLQLDADAQLREDVTAQVRARSLLGEKYVALMPTSQDAPLLRDDGEIRRTAPSVEIDDLVAALGPVLSKVDPDDVATIVSNLTKLSSGLGESGPAILTDLSGLTGTLQGIAEVVPAIQAEIPLLLQRSTQAMKKLEDALGRANSVLEDIDRVAGSAESLLQRLDGAPAAVQEVRELIAQVKPGFGDLNRALEESDDVVKDLRSVLDNLEGFDRETVRKMLREEGVLVRLSAPRNKDKAN